MLIFESLICVYEAAKVGLDTLLKLRPTICKHVIYRATFIFNEPVRRFEELSLTAIFFHLFETHYRCFLVKVDRVEVGLDDLNLTFLHYIHLVCGQAFSGKNLIALAASELAFVDEAYHLLVLPWGYVRYLLDELHVAFNLYSIILGDQFFVDFSVYHSQMTFSLGDYRA